MHATVRYRELDSSEARILRDCKQPRNDQSGGELDNEKCPSKSEITTASILIQPSPCWETMM